MTMLTISSNGYVNFLCIFFSVLADAAEWSIVQTHHGSVPKYTYFRAIERVENYTNAKVFSASHSIVSTDVIADVIMMCFKLSDIVSILQIFSDVTVTQV